MLKVCPRLALLLALVAVPGVTRAASLLTRQISTTDAIAIASQDLEMGTNGNEFDVYVADTFTNAVDWSIASITVPVYIDGGMFGPMDATTLSFRIYADAAGEPAGYPPAAGAAPLWSLSVAPNDTQVTIISLQAGAPIFSVVLNPSTPVALPAGTYWLEFDAQIAYQPYGTLVRWISTDDATSPPAQVISPYGTAPDTFFYTPITAWTPINDPTTYGPELGKTHLAFRFDDAPRDLAPEAFSFTDVTGAALRTLVESETVTVTGFDAATPISVGMGEYSIDGGAYTIDPGVINPGQTVKVRARTSADYLTRHEVILSVGSVNASFRVTTGAVTGPVLWHQPTSTARPPHLGGGVMCADFEVASNAYDLFVADDFTNAEPWYLQKLFIPGVLGNTTSLASATGLVFKVWADAGGVPAGTPLGAGQAPVWQLTVQPTDSKILLTEGAFADTADVTLTLTTPVRFAAGTWWLAFYPRLNLGTNSYVYYRLVADTTNGNEAVAMNPGGGWSPFPTDWTPITDASTWGLTQQDLAFRLDGYVEDLTPEAFTFTDQTDVAVSTVAVSNTITVTGINAAAPISVTGGEYKIGAGGYTAVAGTVSNNALVTVRQTSASTPSTTTDATLTIGGVADTFSVTTVGPDVAPDQFTFTDQTGVATSTVVESNGVTITGINTGATVTITGGEYKINSGSYVTTSGTVNSNDVVTVRQTSSASLATTTDATLTVGGVADTFSVTTVGQQDGGTVQQDGGAVQQDGGAVQQDGGAVQQDGGAVQQDGGAVQQDGGAVQQDGGAVQQDGGAVKQDSGATQADGGGQADAGTTPDDGGGCGCRTSGTDASPAAALLLLGLGLGLVALRRRRS